MPVSFRITHTAMGKDEMCDEIQAIMKYHDFIKPVLVSHSYGTVITTQLLKSPKLADQIGSLVLIDPISVLLHLPDVAYNFTRRKPKRANEHQLHYFGSMDMGVSHSLSRCFFWSENVLWKHEIGDRATTVSLAEQDLIVNTKAVGAYLASYNEEMAAPEQDSASRATNGSVSEKVISQSGLASATNGHAKGIFGALPTKTANHGPEKALVCAQWKDRTWMGRGMDLIWYRTLDHAQVFDKAQTRKPLVEAINEYSTRPC
jgi:hypothetical protein